MGGPNITKSTSVNLYEDDLIILQKKGISISDTLRELLHHLCQNDITDILKSVRIGQTYEQINMLNDKIDQLIKKRDEIDSDIEYYKLQVKEILEHQSIILEHQSRQEQIDRICEVGKAIDALMYNCKFDVDEMIRANIPELEEMKRINPGWSLAEHIRMRKAVGDGSTVFIQ